MPTARIPFAAIIPCLCILSTAAIAQPPPPVPGVCCVGPSGLVCVPVPDVQADCYDQGRRYVIGGTCSPNSCSSAGACCFGATCQANYAPEACMADGGTFVGVGVDCSGSPCTPSQGSCCFSNGSCSVLTSNDCASQGGEFTAGATCSPDPCGMGACCRASSCLQLSAFDCHFDGGTFHGPGTGCQPSPCPPPACACRGDLDGNQVIDGDDVSPFVFCVISAGGGSTPAGCQCADFDNDGSLTPADVDAFATVLIGGDGQPCP